jgi:hypothetical protein
MPTGSRFEGREVMREVHKGTTEKSLKRNAMTCTLTTESNTQTET